MPTLTSGLNNATTELYKVACLKAKSDTHSDLLVGVFRVVYTDCVLRLVSFSDDKIPTITSKGETWLFSERYTFHGGEFLTSVWMLWKLYVNRGAGKQRPDRYSKL